MTEAAELLRLAQGAWGAFIALLMLRAALHKVLDPLRFEGVLADYGLAPAWTIPWLRRLVPAAELVAAGALAWPAGAMAGAWLAGGLLLLYAGAMAAARLGGRHQIDCGCGGPPLPLSWALVARNLVLVALLAPLASSAPAWPTPAAGLAAWAVALVAAACWLAAEQLAANHHRMRTDGALASAAAFGSGP